MFGLSRALRRARDGVSLDKAEARILLEARGEHLTDLCASAARVRDAGLVGVGRTGVITYSPKVFVPVTTLCRDRCHYCTFAQTPQQRNREGAEPFLTPDQVLEIARQGAAAGCAEALFTLGDRSEKRWPEARVWLDQRGYDDTLSYVRALAVMVLEETGLLPHLNPGVMSWHELQRLKPVAPSMGMMVETTAQSLWSTPGGAHFGSPDKDPAVRLRVLEDAGRLSIPFTTGLLVGIGESSTDRVDTLFAIRQSARRHGHVQEVIVQNFRAKPATPMRATPDVEIEEFLAVVAVARLVMGPSMRIQAPPNLVDRDECLRLLAAGIDDWGGVSPVTPDHVNPERPWPDLATLREVTAEAGFDLRARLAVHPPYVRQVEPWLDVRIRPHVAALADPRSGLLVDGARPAGSPWQAADDPLVSRGRVDLHRAIDVDGRLTDRRGDFSEVYGDWSEVRSDLDRIRAAAPVRLGADVRGALAAAERAPAALTDEQVLALLTAEGPALGALADLADAVRADVVGDDVTYVVNRNLNFTNICYVGCRFCAFAQRRTDADAYSLSLEEVEARVAEAWSDGATEICMQGGISPDLGPDSYFELARAVKRAAPDIHLHAFSPMEVTNGAALAGMSVKEWLVEAAAAGVDSIPGTAAEILDDEIRWILTKGKLPTAAWVEVVTTAHSVGMRSSSTMMFGHVDRPEHWLGHLRLVARIQQETGGFTEFVPLPFVHQNAPLYLAGVARPGPTLQVSIAIHAVARLLFHGLIDNVQCSWVKLGVEGTQTMLRSGANDLGGTLMEETISRMAGSQHGSAKSVHDLRTIAAGIGRPARERTTTYGVPNRISERRPVVSASAYQTNQ